MTMRPNQPSPPVVVAGALPRAARQALRRAGARLHAAATADDALGAALAHDALCIVASPALAAEGGGALAELLQATGRAGDLLVLAPRGQAAGRCAWRGLARRVRRRARARRQAEAAWAARPGWQAMQQAYRGHLRDRLAALRAALGSADAAQAQAIVHDIKGTAGGYGLGPLGEVARVAQDHFLAGQHAAAFACCAQLLQRAEEALR